MSLRSVTLFLGAGALVASGYSLWQPPPPPPEVHVDPPAVVALAPTPTPAPSAQGAAIMGRTGPGAMPAAPGAAPAQGG